MESKQVRERNKKLGGKRQPKMDRGRRVTKTAKGQRETREEQKAKVAE